MRDCLLESRPAGSIPIIPVVEDACDAWLQGQTDLIKRWVGATGFKARRGSVCLVPDRQESLAAILTGIKSPDDPWACAGLPGMLPEGDYHIDANWDVSVMERMAIGWGLGAYQFTRYKDAGRAPARLAIDSACNAQAVKNQVQALYLVRDLINTPAEDMMPEDLSGAMIDLGREFGARIEQMVGDELLVNHYPLIHAVGRASAHAPRLIDLRWGDEHHPKLTLVGKGVCFDSGGLDLKSSSNMRLMKKDMGGAAHVIGLARLVMGAGLPVRLRVLVPAVENAVSGNALRPGDVIRSRKGLSIEIDNTDAEGRLILCDALAEAVTEGPDLLIDFATLTGAARVALGTEVPALFCNSRELAGDLLEIAEQERDPLWQLPLHRPYRELLDSKIADIANASGSGYGGAITAALFLQEFIPEERAWMHFDVMAWNGRSRPGRPEGGEAMGLRAVFKYLSGRFGGRHNPDGLA